MKKVNAFTCDKNIRAEARDWVLKFNQDIQPSAKDISELRQWANRSSAHRAELERATAFWCDADLLTQLAVPVGRQNKKQRFRGLGLSTFFFRPAGTITTALFFGLSIVLTAWVYINAGPAGNGIYSTLVGEQKELLLTDGTQIQLDTNSQVRVNYKDEIRQIQLMRGKAHFDVAKNKDRPFEVFAGDGLVRAVGTAFSVYLVDHNVKVTVDEGRVDLALVSSEPGGGKALPGVDNASYDDINEVFQSLEEGESALFNRDKQEVNKLTSSDLSRELAWRRGLLVFTGDPLSKVIAEVNRYTDIDIEILDSELGELSIGGRFRTGELEALFDVLEVGFGVQITFLDKNHVQLGSLTQ